jgi:hypothetical protein
VRFAVTVWLWLTTSAALVFAVPAVWAQKNLIAVDGYVAIAREAAGDPALQAAAASELTARAVVLIKQHGFNISAAEVHPVAARYTAGPHFPPQFADANRLMHSWMFTGADTQVDGNKWVIDLADMLKDSAFSPVLAKYYVQVPARVTVPVTASTPKALQPADLRPLAKWGPWISGGAAALTGICAVLTVAVARRRGRALAGLGVSALLVGAAGWAGIEVARRRINDALNHTDGNVRSIADVMVGDAESSLHHWLNLTLAAGGVLVVLGVLVAMLGSLRRGPAETTALKAISR